MLLYRGSKLFEQTANDSKFQGLAESMCILTPFLEVQRLSQRNPRMQSIRSVTHFLLLDLHQYVASFPGFEKTKR